MAAALRTGHQQSTDEPPISRPHVIVMPYPLQGHITPLMQLSKLLAARGGFAVTFVTSKLNAGLLRRANMKVGGELEEGRIDIKLVGISDGIFDDLLENQGPSLITPHPDIFKECLANLHASFDELVGSMVQQRIACIISDSFLLWTQDVATKWRIPRVSFWPQSLTCFACTRHLTSIVAAYPNFDPFHPQVYEKEHDDECRVVTCVPGVREIHACELPFYTIAGQEDRDWMRHNVQMQIQRVDEALCIVANSFAALEGDVLHALNYKPLFTLGPLLPSVCFGAAVLNEARTCSSLCDEDDECLQWLSLQKHGSVLYISMGSLLTLGGDDIREISMGLEACEQPFLWVLRKRPPLEGQETSSGNDDPVLTRLLTSGQGKVMNWAPQLRVLSHEAVGGFFTHCGWNSTLEAVGMGIPVIGWPQMLDQLTNCWLLVEKLGVGVRLMMQHQFKAKNDAPTQVRHEDVEQAVRKLMQSEEGRCMRTRALQLCHASKMAHSSSLASHLDTFMNTIRSSQHPSLQCHPNE